MRIVIKAAEYDLILAHARACLPDEACGLIAGLIADDEKKIEKVYPLLNLDHSPEHFSIDQREQFLAIKDMRARGLAPLGNFHSHPGTPARPSAEDIKLARDPEASYLILSLVSDEPVLKSFQILMAEGRVREEPLHLIR
jgi:proteasome lid subunit RPN8/RPN11